jgi:hypothetical protein
MFGLCSSRCTKEVESAVAAIFGFGCCATEKGAKVSSRLPYRSDAQPWKPDINNRTFTRGYVPMTK